MIPGGPFHVAGSSANASQRPPGQQSIDLKRHPLGSSARRLRHRAESEEDRDASDLAIS